MANGNSRAARSARAKKQLRDSKGRWIEMGRSRVTWYSSKAGKNLAGTAMKITDDGENAVVSVSDDQGVATDHVVSGKSLTIVNSKVTLPSTGKEPSNPKFYEKQAKNIAALELPEGADESTQAAFDNAFDTIKVQDKISPGINKNITDSNGAAVNYGDLVETKKGPAFVIGVIPATNSTVLAFSDGSVKTTKGHLQTVKDKGAVVPEQDSSPSEAPSEAPESTSSEDAPASEEESGVETKEAWEIDNEYLDNAPVGTTLTGEDGMLIAQRASDGWNNANGEPAANDDVLDDLLDYAKVQVSQKEPEEVDAEPEDVFKGLSVVHDGKKVTATLPDGSSVSINNFLGKKFAVVARPKIQGASEWEVRLANSAESALQDTGVSDQVFNDIKILEIADKEEESTSAPATTESEAEPETPVEETPEQETEVEPEAPTQITEPELEAWEKELLTGQPVDVDEDDADSAEEQKMVDDALGTEAGTPAEETEAGSEEEPWDEGSGIMDYVAQPNGAMLISPSGEEWTKKDDEWFSDSGEILGNYGLNNRVIKEGGDWTVKASTEEAPAKGFAEGPLDKTTDAPWSIDTYFDSKPGTQLIGPDGKMFTKGDYQEWTSEKGGVFGNSGVKWEVTKNTGEEWTAYPEGNAPEVEAPATQSEDKYAGLADWEKELLYGIDTTNKEESTPANAFGEDHEVIDKSTVSVLDFTKKSTGSTIVNSDGDTYTKVAAGWEDQNGKFIPTIPLKNMVKKSASDWAFGPRDLSGPKSSSEPESTPTPEETTPEQQPNQAGKITAQNFVKKTGSDEQGNYYTDANGKKVYEGEEVDYNKAKGKTYNAKVAKVNKNNVILSVPELGKNFTAQQHKVFKKETTPTHSISSQPEETAEAPTPEAPKNPNAITQQELDDVPENSVIKDQDGDDVFAKNSDGTWDYLPEPGGTPVASEDVVSDMEGAYAEDSDASYSLVPAETATPATPTPEVTLEPATNTVPVEYDTDIEQVTTDLLNSAKTGDKLFTGGSNGYIKQDDGKWLSEGTGNSISPEAVTNITGHIGSKYKLTDPNAKQAVVLEDGKTYDPGTLDKEALESMQPGDSLKLSFGGHSYTKKEDGTWFSSASGNNVEIGMMSSFVKGAKLKFQKASELPKEDALTPGPLDPEATTEKQIDSLPTGTMITNVSVEDGSVLVYEKVENGSWDVKESITAEAHNSTTSKILEDIMKTYPNDDFELLPLAEKETSEPTPQAPTQPTVSSPAQDNQKLSASELTPEFVQSIPVGDGIETISEDGDFKFVYKKDGDDLWASYDSLDSTTPIGDMIDDDEIVAMGEDFPDAPYTYKQSASNKQSTPEEEAPANSTEAPSGPATNGQTVPKADINPDFMKSMPVGAGFKYTADGMPGSYFMKKAGDDAWEISNGLAKKANSYQESTQSMFDEFIADEPAGEGKGKFEYIADINKGDASFSDPEPSELDYNTLNQAPKNTKITVDGKGFTKNFTGNWIADTDIDVNDSEAMGNIIEETPNATKTISYPDMKTPEQYQNSSDTSGGSSFSNGQQIKEPLTVEQMDAMPVGAGFQNKTSISTMWFVKKDDGKWTVSTNSDLSNGFDIDTDPLQVSFNGMITNSANTLKYLTDAKSDPNPTLQEGATPTPTSDTSSPHPNGVVDSETSEQELINVAKESPIGAKFWPENISSHLGYTKEGENSWVSDTGGHYEDYEVGSNLKSDIGYTPYTYTSPGGSMAPTPSTNNSAPYPNGEVDSDIQYDELLDIAKKSPVGAKFWPNNLSDYFGYTKTGENEWISDTNSYKDDEDVAYYLSNEGIPEDNYTYTSPGGTMETPSSSSKDTGTAFVDGVYTKVTPNLQAKIENAPVGAKLTPSNMSSNYEMTKDENGDWITDTNDYMDADEVYTHILETGDKFTATGGSTDSSAPVGWGSVGGTQDPTPQLISDTFINGKIDIKASDVLDKLKNAPIGAVLTPGDMGSNYEFTKVGDDSWKTDTGQYKDAEGITNYFGYKNDTYTAKNFPDPTPVTPEVPTLDTKGWTKLSGAQGSNDGGVYENPDGEKYYLKMPASEAHAKNEVLADKFYQMAGIDTSKLELSDYGGSQLGTASKMLEGSEKNLESKLSDPAYKQKLQEGFAMDAWLANWDVAGTGYDNVVTDANGNPVRVDPGGALLFRAMGSPKGDQFTDEVGELDSLRNGSNSYSKAIFGDMTDIQIATSIDKVKAITPEQIDLMVDSMDFDDDTAKLYKDKLKKRRQNLIDRRKEFVPEPTFAGADSNAYNQEGKGLSKYSDNPSKPASTYEYGDIDDPKDNPLYGAPQPVKPAPVPYQTFDFSQPKILWEGRDEWLKQVEERFDANPAKNAASVQQSANWNKIQAILDGDTEYIDYLVTKKYLTPEMAETAKTGIQNAKDNLDTDDATKQMQKAKDEYEAKTQQYTKDLAEYQTKISEWNAVNGTNSTKPAPKDIQMPDMSTEELWEETSDWSKANHGTFSAEDVFKAVQGSNDTANHGLSMAIDSDQIENHDVRVTRIVGTDGKEHMRFEFKLTSEKGNQFAENLGDYQKQSGMSYPKLHLSTSTGLLTDTGTTTYDESNGETYKKTLDGDRNVVFRKGFAEEEVYDYNAGGKILRKQSTFHNQISLTMPADTTPEDFAKTLAELNIKATPSTQGDVRVLAENKLMKAFGKYNPGDEDKTAIDPTKNFQFEDRQKQLDYIKEKYGITIDDVSVATDESGHNRIQLSDEAAKKLADRHNIDYFQHTFTYNNPTVEALTRIMTGSVPALRPAADRGMNGISATGQSAEADHQSGAGDYVFTTPKSGSGKYEGVQIDAVKVFKNLDLWANNGDDWGARKLDVSKTPHEILDQHNGHVHEVLVQSAIPVAWWTHVTVDTQEKKTELIENLTKAGITAVNGKTLSDFIKTKY